MWTRYCCSTIFSDSQYMPWSCRYSPTKLCDGAQTAIFVGPFVKRFAPCYQTVVCLSCLSVLSVCLSVLSETFVHCGQTVGRIKMKLGLQVGLGPGHILLDGTQLPLPKGAQPPNFRPISVAAKWLHESRCHLVWS